MIQIGLPGEFEEGDQVAHVDLIQLQWFPLGHAPILPLICPLAQAPVHVCLVSGETFPQEFQMSPSELRKRECQME